MALWRVLGRGWVRSSSRARTLSQLTPNVTPDEAPMEEEDLIEQKRNKSRLKEKHYKVHHRLAPRLTEDEEIVEPLKYQRKLYGVYGAASGINVAKLWPSKEELELEKEYEKVARPYTVQEMISMARKAKEEEEEARQQRQADLKRKMAKLEGWKKEVRDRIQKQEREAQLAKEKKEKLIEEVRQIIGFQIDPKDERFKEALEKKEQEEKKAKKAAKKLKSQQRLIDRLRREADPIPASSASSQDSGNKDQPEGEESGISPGSPIV